MSEEMSNRNSSGNDAAQDNENGAQDIISALDAVLSSAPLWSSDSSPSLRPELEQSAASVKKAEVLPDTSGPGSGRDVYRQRETGLDLDPLGNKNDIELAANSNEVSSPRGSVSEISTALIAESPLTIQLQASVRRVPGTPTSAEGTPDHHHPFTRTSGAVVPPLRRAVGSSPSREHATQMSARSAGPRPHSIFSDSEDDAGDRATEGAARGGGGRAAGARTSDPGPYASRSPLHYCGEESAADGGGADEVLLLRLVEVRSPY